MPFVRPIVKLATTTNATPEIPGLVNEAFAITRHPHTKPVFLDFPLDIVFMEAEPAKTSEVPAPRAPQTDGADLEQTVALLQDAERPVIMAGTNLY